MYHLKDSGFIIRITPHKEKDTLLKIFSKKDGVNNYYLKNVRTPKSNRNKNIELLNYIDFSYSEKSEGLRFLSDLKLKNKFDILKNINTYYAETYILSECLNSTLNDNIRNPEIFNLLVDVSNYISNYTTDNEIEQADVNKNDSRILLSLILLRIISESGYLPDISHCQINNNILEISDNIGTLPDKIGYAKMNSSPDKDILKVIKIQKFWLNDDVNLKNLINLKLTDHLLDKIINIELNWCEIIIGRKLKSRNMLIFKN